MDNVYELVPGKVYVGENSRQGLDFTFSHEGGYGQTLSLDEFLSGEVLGLLSGVGEKKVLDICDEGFLTVGYLTVEASFVGSWAVKHNNYKIELTEEQFEGLMLWIVQGVIEE